MFTRLFRFHQAEDNAGTPGGGSADGAGAGAAGAAAGAGGAAGAAGAAGGAAGAAAGAAAAAGAGAAGQAGNGGTPSDQEQFFELEPGQKLTKAQLKEAWLKSQDYTKKTQMTAAERKKYQAAAAHADQIAEEYLAELKKLRGEKEPEPEEKGPEHKVTELEKTVQQMQERVLADKWERTYAPVAEKYPDLDDIEVAVKFSEMVAANKEDPTTGVENSKAGLMKVAEMMAQERTGKLNAQLEKELGNPANKIAATHDEKVIAELLKNPANPKLQAYNQMVIAQYKAGKLQLASAAGDNGAGPGAGAGTEKAETIDQVRTRQMLRLRE